MDDETHSRLCALLRDDPSAGVRSEAAHALGVAGVEAAGRALEPLLTALDDESESVRRAATLALGRTRDRRAGEALVGVLAERPELWKEASAAIARAGGRELVATLRPLLEAESVEVRRGAVRAIAGVTAADRLGRDETPPLVYGDEEGLWHALV